MISTQGISYRHLNSGHMCGYYVYIFLRCPVPYISSNTEHYTISALSCIWLVVAKLRRNFSHSNSGGYMVKGKDLLKFIGWTKAR